MKKRDHTNNAGGTEMRAGRQLSVVKLVHALPVLTAPSKMPVSSLPQPAGSLSLSHASSSKAAEHIEEAIANALREGRGSITKVAKILQSPRRVIETILQCSPTLREIKTDCEERAFERAYSNLCQGVKSGDLDASMYMVRLFYRANNPGRANPSFDAVNDSSSGQVSSIQAESVHHDDITDEDLTHLNQEDLLILMKAKNISDKLRKRRQQSLSAQPTPIPRHRRIETPPDDGPRQV